jgi:hypothetical protein
MFFLFPQVDRTHLLHGRPREILVKIHKLQEYVKIGETDMKKETTIVGIIISPRPKGSITAS